MLGDNAMIEIRNKEECCGCTTCESVCPKHCISMKSDEEGFLYPHVDVEKCVNCHLCEKKCPIKGKKKVRNSENKNKALINRRAIKAAAHLPKSYVCFLNDSNIRCRSTSGGAFTALAWYVLKNSGILCGVILNDEQKVVHYFSDNEDGLAKMRGSKYVQSYQSGVYSKIRNILLDGRLVLYTGTPCQVAGLHSYLGKNYDNLITVDVFCHGTGSPLYWKKYVDYMSKKYKAPIKEIHFREKTYGYNSACLAVYFENGKSSHKGHDDDLYWSAFSKNYIYRPSCYACAFKTVNHISDFSIGDFWNAEHLPNKFREANGCSLLLCHTLKSKKMDIYCLL